MARRGAFYERGYGPDGGGAEYGDYDVGQRDYRTLKSSGLWNLTDQNSDTWKFLQAQSGNFGDIKTNPMALMWALDNVSPVPAKDLAGYEQNRREMLSGLNPQFIDPFIAAGRRYQEEYENNRDKDNSFSLGGILEDAFDGFREIAVGTAPIWGAALGGAAAIGQGPLAGISSAAGGGVGGGAAAGASLGGFNSLLTGQDIFQGALRGGISGGAGAAVSRGLGGDFNSLDSASAVAAGTGEPGMWDWLDGLADPFEGFSVDPSLGDLGGDTSFWGGGGQGNYYASMPDGEMFRDPFDLLPNGDTVYQTPEVMDMPLPNGGLTGGGVNPSLLDRFLNAGRGLLGGGGSAGGGAGGAQTGQTPGGSAWDLLQNDPLQAAFNATPFLLALREANRQGDDLNGVIRRINGDSYSRSVLNPYDMDTGIGRTNMLQDQELRGVRGSSFGDQSLTNYDYMRSLGRGDLSSRANLASAGLEGQLINQRNTNRNMLLGAGLSASGRLFESQRDPFGLARILGGR
jgi:hypothetical protein